MLLFSWSANIDQWSAALDVYSLHTAVCVLAAWSEKEPLQLLLEPLINPYLFVTLVGCTFCEYHLISSILALNSDFGSVNLALDTANVALFCPFYR